jgi:probable addiction module antidote protein
MPHRKHRTDHPGELLYLAGHSHTHSVGRTREIRKANVGGQENSRRFIPRQPNAISVYLTEKLEKNNFDATRTALGLIVRAQNVQILARDAGLRRDTLYKTFGGKVDPHLSRVLKVFGALNLHFQVVPSAKCDFPPQQHLSPPPHNERPHAQLFRDDNEATATYLTHGFAGNDLEQAVEALYKVTLAQNKSALARNAGIPRRTLYNKADPPLSRILKLFAALSVRFAVVRSPHREKPPRPKLGRPRK